MIVVGGVVKSINHIFYHSCIIRHAVQGMDTRRMGIDADLVSHTRQDFVTVLVEELDAIQSYVEEVAMSRVKVDFQCETHRHCYGLVFLVKTDES